MTFGELLDAAGNRVLGSAPKEVLGLWLSVLSTLCASTMGLLAKLAGGRGVPVFEIVLARSVVLMALTVPQLAHQRLNPLRSDRKSLLLLRGLLGFCAVSTFYGTVQYLPLSDTAVLMFLAPLFVAALSPLLLGELPSRGVWTAIPLSILGVVLVSQPTFLFGGQQALSALGVVLGVLQAAFSASAKMCIRALGSTEPVQVIVASMAAVSIAGASLMCAVLPAHFVRPADAATWLLLLGTRLLGFGNQYLSTAALKLSSAAPAVAMSYVAVVWGLFLDLLLFHDAPGPLSLLGAAVVCGSSWLVVRAEQQRSSGGGGESGRSGGAPPAAAKQQQEQQQLLGGGDGSNGGKEGRRGEAARDVEGGEGAVELID